MAHIKIIDEHEATGRLAANYRYLSDSYSAIMGTHVPAPQVYRTPSIVEPYFNFGAVQNRVLTNDGKHNRPQGPVPSIMVNFALSMYSSCFY
jgi:hypothetical protein